MTKIDVGELNRAIAGCGHRLSRTPQHLELQSLNGTRSRPLCVDFVGGPTGFRRMTGQSRQQPIARAVGIKGEAPYVIDATAGLGRDAFLLACLGCRVAMIERSRVLGALLADGLTRAAGQSAALDRIIGRLTLTIGDSRDILAALSRAERPEVVYLDPMYAPSKRTALSKKELRICRELVGDDADAVELLETARAVATQRVVVKRHPDAPPLAPDPTVSYKGRTVRYDAYLGAPSSSGSGICTSKSRSMADS